MAMDDVVFFFPLLTKAAGLLGLQYVVSEATLLACFCFNFNSTRHHTHAHALARRRATCGVRSIDASGAAGGSRICLLFASEATLPIIRVRARYACRDARIPYVVHIRLYIYPREHNVF